MIILFFFKPYLRKIFNDFFESKRDFRYSESVKGKLQKQVKKFFKGGSKKNKKG
jgi:hypothetical protein